MSAQAIIPGERPRFVLLESGDNAHKKQSKGGLLLSVSLHLMVIAAAIYVTVNAGKDLVSEKVNPEKLVFVKPEVPKPEPPKPEPPKPVVKAAPKEVHVAPKPKAAAPTVPSIAMPPAPVTVPVEIPPVDMSMPVTQEPQIGASGGRAGEAAGGTAKPGEGGLSSGDANKAYSDFEVEEAARPGGGAPNYPDFLRQSGQEGEVQTEFIIGPNGRVESGSIKILNSNHEAFTRAVKDYLNRAKYRPGRVGGKGVRQVVQQTFSFRINR